MTNDLQEALRNLVPPPALCGLISAEEFTGSALVWYRATISGDCIVLPRLYKNVDAARTVAPAPTLAEVMEAIAALGYLVPSCEICDKVCQARAVNTKYKDENSPWEIYAFAREICVNADTPATAALRLWFSIKNEARATKARGEE